MLKIVLTLCPLSALVSACSITSIGAESRARHEEAAVHKLLDGQQSFSTVVAIMEKRSGWDCVVQRPNPVADTPKMHVKVLSCRDKEDWELPPFGCSWSVNLLGSTQDDDDVIRSLVVTSDQACN